MTRTNPKKLILAALIAITLTAAAQTKAHSTPNIVTSLVYGISSGSGSDAPAMNPAATSATNALLQNSP
jgi:hypothetical protein